MDLALVLNSKRNKEIKVEKGGIEVGMSRDYLAAENEDWMGLPLKQIWSCFCASKQRAAKPITASSFNKIALFNYLYYLKYYFNLSNQDRIMEDRGIRERKYLKS